MTKKKTKSNKILIASSLGALALLIAGVIFLTPEQFDKAWLCSATSSPAKSTIHVFDSVSRTNVTGYYTVNGTKKSYTCSRPMISLKVYCAAHPELDCSAFLRAPSGALFVPQKYSCDTRDCVPIAWTEGH